METFAFAQCNCTLIVVEQLSVDYLIIEKKTPFNQRMSYNTTTIMRLLETMATQ